MFPAEGTVLAHFETVSGVFLVFLGIIVALFTLFTAQGDFHPVASLCHGIGASFFLDRGAKKPAPLESPGPAAGRTKSPEKRTVSPGTIASL